MCLSNMQILAQFKAQKQHILDIIQLFKLMHQKSLLRSKKYQLRHYSFLFSSILLVSWNSNVYQIHTDNKLISRWMSYAIKLKTSLLVHTMKLFILRDHFLGVNQFHSVDKKEFV